MPVCCLPLNFDASTLLMQHFIKVKYIGNPFMMTITNQHILSNFMSYRHFKYIEDQTCTFKDQLNSVNLDLDKTMKKVDLQPNPKQSRVK